MTVRVRFAPSPTGYLHVGGARTALYCFLYARHCKGQYVLRIEDTDMARSSSEYEQLQINDLKWLGVCHDEGPDVAGPHIPYRQSERLDIFKKYAEQLVEEKKAFYCFCSEEELTQKKEKAEAQGLAPHYDGTCHHLSKEEISERVARGEKPVIRFKAIQKEYTFTDHVRGAVTFPPNMVGDFVILRSDGNPVYNFSCVIDDWLMQMTHVLRAEEHLPNTLRQLMIYEALKATPPEFAHLSLIIGEDRQKLSKRHGATSVLNFREEGYLPEAMVNYLVTLGWSHPEEKDIFSMEELIACFDINRFSKAPAIFNYQKLRWVNGQHIRLLSDEELWKRGKEFIDKDHPFHEQTVEWQIACFGLLKNKLDILKDINEHISLLLEVKMPQPSDAYQEILMWETTPVLRDYLQTEIAKVTTPFIPKETVDAWMTHCKSQLKIKGKFLMMGIRGLITGQEHGPDLIGLLTLTPTQVIKSRLN